LHFHCWRSWGRHELDVHDKLCFLVQAYLLPTKLLMSSKFLGAFITWFIKVYKAVREVIFHFILMQSKSSAVIS
jgi:hypothetical protein